jgi:hypothetical protein
MNNRTIFMIVLLLVLVVVLAILISRSCGGAAAIIGGAVPTHLLKPAGKGPHGHTAALDPSGTGESSTTLSHAHRVHNYVAAPAPPDMHTHDITRYIVSSENA